MNSYAKHTRNTPADPVDQQHGADNQSDADGGGVENAQGSTGCPRRPSVRAALVSHPARNRRPAPQFQPPAAGGARSPQSSASSSSLRIRASAERSTPTCSAWHPSSIHSPRSSSRPDAGRRSSSARTRRQLVAEFTYGDTPRFPEARAIAALASDLFLKGEVDQVKVIATRFVNTLTLQPLCLDFLPIGELIEGNKGPGSGVRRETGCRHNRNPV